MAWVFPILLGFISTPILIRNLGHESYGVFAIVLGFISYSFTFGIGKIAGKYVPEYRSDNEPEKVTQVVSGTFWLSLAIGVVGSAALVVAAPFIVRDLLLISPASQQSAIYSLYLASGVGLAIMLSQVFQSVLQGLHRFDNYLALTNLSGVLLGGGNIVLAINGFGVPVLMGWNLIVVSSVGFLFYIRARSLLPSLKLVTDVPRAMTVTISRYAGNILLYQILANILFIFERSWVMRKFGAEGLTYYYVPMLLAMHMHGFIASLVLAIFPVVNETLKDRERVAMLYRRANKIILATVIFTVTNFIAAGSLFLQLWVSPELSAASYALLIPHGLTFGILGVGVMAFQLAEAFKFPALNVIITGAWTLLAIPAMIFAADIAQSEGIAWARFLTALVWIPIVAYAERRFLGSVQIRFWCAVGVRVLLAAGLMAVIERLVLSSLSDSYLSLGLAGAAGSLIFVATLAATGFLNKEDREVIMRSLFRRGSIEKNPETAS